MVYTKEKQSLQQWMRKLVCLHDELKKKNDLENAEKVSQLIKKVYHEEFIIAFCGHFSAGKSSMINKLIGEQILPSSPIPTSANLVKVKSGKEYARVYYKNEPPVEYPAPYNYEEIKTYCKDGDTIESIEISTKTDRLPTGIVIMDTPGIDSTDDAHRIATESAIHLADVVFYTMDYNHVLSELNFQFTKELTEYGKSVYIIVNQIDKHRDEELPFSGFKQTVIQAFRDWNVAVEDFFFTSLKKPNLTNNEFDRLTNFLQKLFKEKESRFEAGISSAVKQIIDNHIHFLQVNDAKEEEKLKAHLQRDTSYRETIEEIEQLENELKKVENNIREIEKNFRSELNNVLEHAYIMPFETRELAKEFLESLQPDFKVGLFFAKAKTVAEKERRQTAFYENVKEKVRTNMEWHVRELLVRVLKEHQVHENDLLTEAQQLSVNITPEILSNVVKKGAGVTGDYILTYTSDVANEFKKRYRDEALRIFERFLLHYRKDIDKRKEALNGELNDRSEQLSIQKRLEELESARNEQYNKLLNLLNEQVHDTGDIESVVSSFVAEPFVLKTTDAAVKKTTEEAKSSTEVESDRVLAKKQNSKIVDSDQVVKDLLTAANMIQGINGMKRFVELLKQKAVRLENRAFTVALFGAFSAGKSSFANALIGEKVLPVSPNPTTATINKIVPPTADHPHGTVLVQLKDRDQLLKDLQWSLRYFNFKPESLDEAFHMSRKALNVKSVDAREKPHYSFIKAVVQGFEAVQHSLGQTLRVDLPTFQQYVADEEKACFVEWIELYFDSPLTKQGVTLVDTPGADSVNARHTGVAFEYIKNADAILFVTYYNHAFSKADREFLIQLGRVKDTFSMDKMFFIVNAADLAHSYEELNDVLAYVEGQLLQFGIRNPRMYSVSSRFALEEKMGITSDQHYGILKESGIRQFEADFNHFIIEDLTALAVTSAYTELHRARNTIKKYIAEAELDIAGKEAKLQEIAKEKDAIRRFLETIDIDNDIQAFEQEVSELTYYIRQRIFLRFGDWFKESFNPSVLREDGRDMKKVLQSCLQELIHSIGFDLAQEMRATSLRAEKYLIKLLHERFARLDAQVANIHSGIKLSNVERYEFDTPVFKQGLEDLDLVRFKKALSYFKNVKSFFEQDEKRHTREELEKQLQQPVSDYLFENQLYLQNAYREQFIRLVQHLHRDLQQQVDEHFAGLTSVLTEPLNIEELRAIQRQLDNMLGVN